MTEVKTFTIHKHCWSSTPRLSPAKQNKTLHGSHQFSDDWGWRQTQPHISTQKVVKVEDRCHLSLIEDWKCITHSPTRVKSSQPFVLCSRNKFVFSCILSAMSTTFLNQEKLSTLHSTFITGVFIPAVKSMAYTVITSQDKVLEANQILGPGDVELIEQGSFQIHSLSVPQSYLLSVAHIRVFYDESRWSIQSIVSSNV